ncbi:MAG: large subunit ribosomal protein L16 [Parcubacteria group bacterium Gr01-1014_44]|nr:MAG: large subunit ribosomal protein L16 [Parcubacteria group bacterium Gr01-1014_44]
MLQPKRIKHRKVHVGRLQAKTSRGFDLSFGAFGLKSLESSFINAKQIESARRTMTRFIQRGGKIWIRIFPDKPMTAKPPEVGMGGGAGALKEFVSAVSAGRILFEMDGVTEQIAREAFRLASFKLPVKTRFIKR